MEESPLLKLPVEILHRIFDFCDTQTILCKIGRACKTLHSIVNQYDRLHVKFNIHMCRESKRDIPRHLQVFYERAVSLSCWWYYASNIQKEIFIFDLLQCKRLRHLTLSAIDDKSMQSLFIEQNNMKLVSLTIDSKDCTSNASFKVVSSFIEKSKLQKLIWKYLFYKAEEMSWPDQCKLKSLVILRCFYDQYSYLLHQLPYLETFQIQDIYTRENPMYLPLLNFSFHSSLTRLCITYCALSIEHFRSLISKTPALCELILKYSPEKFQSLMEIYEWEEFVRLELNFLKKFQFFIPYRVSKNDPVRLDTIIAPFRDPFWLNEKRWFTICGQIIGAYEPDTISLFTIPITQFIHMSYFDSLYVKCGFSSKDNIYYINKQSRNEITSETVHDTLPVVHLAEQRIETSHLRIFAYALRNNQITIELNLYNNKIDALGTQYLVEALVNNTTLIKLNLGRNNIHDEGAKHIAHLLETSKTLRKLELDDNKISAIGAQHLSYALQHNNTLTILNLGDNVIGDEGVKHITDALNMNHTLKELDLHRNKITDDGVKSLSEVLQNNNTLEKMNLENNNIGDDGAKDLAFALKMNKVIITFVLRTMTTLDLKYNKIDLSGMECLYNELQHNTTLTQLSLDNNKCEYHQTVSKLLQIRNDYNLTQISLYGNNIDNNGIKFIVDALRQNTALEELELKLSEINADGAKYLVDGFREMTTIKKLNLSARKYGIVGILSLIDPTKNNATQTFDELIFNYICHRRQRRRYYTSKHLENMISLQRNTTINKSCETFGIIADIRKDSILYKDLPKKFIQSTGAQHIYNTLRHGMFSRNLHVKICENALNEMENNTTIKILNINTCKIHGSELFQIIINKFYDHTFLTIEINSDLINQVIMNYLSGILLYNSILLTLNITTSKALSSINITQDLSNFLQNHATLTTLCLQNIQIDYQRIEILSSALKGLRKLETLILSRVNMRPIVAESLANALDNITTLSILRLDSNRIGDKGIQFLMKIFKINALKEIDLSNNQLGYGDGIQILAEFLQANTTLLKLNLSNNQIAFSGSKYLSNALEKNTTLTSLYLRSDNIDDRGIENLSQALKINKTLEHIDVSNNPFGNNGIEYFQVLLQVNKTLTELQIGFKYDKYQGNLVQKSETKEVMDE